MEALSELDFEDENFHLRALSLAEERATELVTSVVDWLEEMKRELGTYEYLEGAKESVKTGAHDLVSFDYLKDENAVSVGDPDEVIQRARAYEEAGVDILLCLLDPHEVPHEKCMQSIELIGKHVIPEFERG